MSRRLRACAALGPCLAALAIAWALLACGPEPHLAGGTGIETTNGIAGGVHDGTTPVRNARVSLYPEDFNPYRDTLPDSLRVRTGDDGRFEIRGIPSGRYNVLAETSPQGIASMMLDVAVGEKGKVNLEQRELRPRGAVKVPRGEGVAQGAGYLYIPGSPWIVTMSDVEGTEDFVLLPDIAPAAYVRLRFVGGDADLDTNILADTLKVEPADTVLVPPYPRWGHVRSLYLNTTSKGAGVAEDIAGFPILVRLDSSRFDFSQALPEGRDIRFSLPDGTPLPYQIERWDAAARKADIWVRVDTVQGSSDTNSIRMHWGRSDAVDISDSRKVFALADGFAGVWHLTESDTGANGSPAYRNSVEDANHGSDFVRSEPREGVAGRAQYFDGTGNEFIHVPAATARLKPDMYITVSGWYKASACDSGGASIATMGDSWGLKMDQNGRTRLFVYVGGSPRSPLTNLSVMDGKWHLLIGTYDGTMGKSYVDGVMLKEEAETGPIGYTLGKDFFIGRHGNGQVNVDALGEIDEVQVSASARSDGWIKLLYENQKPGATWIEFR